MPGGHRDANRRIGHVATVRAGHRQGLRGTVIQRA
jgi:hypothetical protein